MTGRIEEPGPLLIVDDEPELLGSGGRVHSDAAQAVQFMATIPARPAAPNSQVH